MSFIKYIPIGNKRTHDLSTTTDKEIQIWQEFTMLRHISTQGIHAKIVTAPYIDQAKIYYCDARSSNWKSAGLLYYYSFLNLAKAFILAKRSVSAKYLKSTSIYHGLQANPQKPSKIIDFVVNIHPSISNNRKNIFSLFYEKITNRKWPFSSPLNIPIGDVMGYCSDISHELSNFYNTARKELTLQSIIREHQDKVWLEVAVPNDQLAAFKGCLSSSIELTTSYTNMSADDKYIWFTAHNRTPVSLKDCSLLRISQMPVSDKNGPEQYKLLQKNVEALFRDYILLMPVQDFNTDNFWLFIPKISLNGTQMVWHPLLSNYLFAFVLSTVLRYHPHIFHTESQNSFIAEAWCNQSPVTTLRYFLMNFTSPSTRIN